MNKNYIELENINDNPNYSIDIIHETEIHSATIEIAEENKEALISRFEWFGYSVTHERDNIYTVKKSWGDD